MINDRIEPVFNAAEATQIENQQLAGEAHPLPSWRQLRTDPVLLLAFGFGSGRARKAPGTWGTLMGVALYPLLAMMPAGWFGAFLAIVFVVGIPICGIAARKLGVHDHGGIVFDEMVGYWIAMFGFAVTWYWLLAGFVLFRFFDIVKPWPIGWLDRRVSGGLGIMLDDVLAGLFAWLVLSGITWMV